MTDSKNWITTADRFVAFFDIMGFKDFVTRFPHENIYHMMLDIANFRDEIEANAATDKKNQTLTYTTTFSDSIVMFSKDDTPESFAFFSIAASWLFASAIEKNIPMKGAISHGLTSVNKSKQIYFGQSIIDAYLLQEDVNYYGVVFHNSIDGYIMRNDNSIGREDFFEAKTFLKSGQITHNNLDWFDVYMKDKTDVPDSIQQKLKFFSTLTSGYPRKYIDNTLEMFERSRK